MTTQGLFIALATILCTAAKPQAGAAGGAPAAGPLEQIKQTTDTILAVLRNPELRGPEKKEARRKKMRDAVDARFNWPAMAQRALATHWKKRTPQERRHFVPLFTELVRRTYMSKIEGYAGETVRYKGERLQGAYARVSVLIVTTKHTEIPVTYSMKQAGEQWLVYDVAIEGVRLCNNYRTQFRDLLSRMAYKEFVEELEAKVAELKDE